MLNEQEMLSYFETELESFAKRYCARPAELRQAVLYSLSSGGKRIRPLISMLAASAAGGNWKHAIHSSMAIELLHTYTLIHDDLPSMDNDVMRRGKPTVWKVFGETNAILSGDVLQALSFKAASLSAVNTGKIVAELADGAIGVVAGQVEDIRREKNSREADIDFIYRHKTADLFVASARMGAYSALASDEVAQKMGEFALNLGLAFQFQDDLLDGDSPYGEEETRRIIESKTQCALRCLEGFPGDIENLVNLSERLVGRKA